MIVCLKQNGIMKVTCNNVFFGKYYLRYDSIKEILNDHDGLSEVKNNMKQFHFDIYIYIIFL